ncbi:flotillin domain-containing protein [Klebsiella pneumoniae]
MQPSYNNNSVENTQTTLSDQVVNSALHYHSQAPLFDNLMNELGLRL